MSGKFTVSLDDRHREEINRILVSGQYNGGSRDEEVLLWALQRSLRPGSSSGEKGRRANPYDVRGLPLGSDTSAPHRPGPGE